MHFALRCRGGRLINGHRDIGCCIGPLCHISALMMSVRFRHVKKYCHRNNRRSFGAHSFAYSPPYLNEACSYVQLPKYTAIYDRTQRSAAGPPPPPTARSGEWRMAGLVFLIWFSGCWRALFRLFRVRELAAAPVEDFFRRLNETFYGGSCGFRSDSTWDFFFGRSILAREWLAKMTKTRQNENENFQTMTNRDDS